MLVAFQGVAVASSLQQGATSRGVLSRLTSTSTPRVRLAAWITCRLKGRRGEAAVPFRAPHATKQS